MAEWAATARGVCGYGPRGRVRVSTEGWRPGGHPPPLALPASAIAVGTVDGFRLPDGTARLRGDADTRLTLGRLPDGPNRISVDANLETSIAFDGSATVDSSTPPWIRFSEPTAIAVGFSDSATVRPTVSVPATPDGLATAVTAAGRTHVRSGPMRSNPGFRPPTPRVTFGEESLPDDLVADDETATVVVPDEALAVLVAAPLAYYLGATVTVDDGPPTLVVDDFERRFDPLPAFAKDVAGILRRLCYLDSRIRSGPCESTLPARGVETTALCDAPVVDRLRAALDVPSASLPDWPLAVYASERIENGRYLPYVLDTLATVHPADASSLDPRALLKRSLEEFFRGDSPNVDAVDPTLADGRSHAWLGDGVPVDAYTLAGSPTPTPTSGGLLDIHVVCNDAEMAAEREVADVYSRRIDDRTVDVTVHDRLSTSRLADVFERPSDLVHFVGHCEVDGLVCADGTLKAADLEACRANAFFLNACGSYYEGHDLIRKGAAVGAVTLTPVLDDAAVVVGTTFARLLAAGFSVDRALSLARGEIIVGRDYAVVGDGTARLRPARGRPALITLVTDGSTFEVDYEVTTPDGAGGRYVDPFGGNERLRGEVASATMTTDDAVKFLGRFSLPVRVDGELRWSDEVAAALTTTGQQS